MPMTDYICDTCGYANEYNNSETAPPSMKPPKNLKCPHSIKKTDKNGKTRNYKCKGKLEAQFVGATAFDIIGYCYENDYGKKAWKRNLSQSEQAQGLTGNKGLKADRLFSPTVLWQSVTPPIGGGGRRRKS